MVIPSINSQSTTPLTRIKHSPPPFSATDDLADDKPQGAVIPSNTNTNTNTSSRPKRKRISPDQFQALSDIFEHTDTPNFELREQLALRLNMTNREVQVWFQNRRAKFNRVRQQELRKRQIILDHQHHHQHHHRQHQQDVDVSLKPSYWPTEAPQDHPSYSDDTYSSTSTSSSPSFTPISSPYPALSPEMTPLDILALAARYVERCDQEQEAIVKKQKTNITTALSSCTLSATSTTSAPTTTSPTSNANDNNNNNNNNTHKSWRPWL